MLRLAWLEIRKVSKRYGRLSLVALAVTVAISACIGYFAMVSGVTSDLALYTSNVEINSSTFTVSQNPDILVADSTVFVHWSDSSLAAADEFRAVVMQEYREYIEKEYGDLAYPLMVSVKYIKAGGSSWVNLKNATKSEGITGKGKAGGVGGAGGNTSRAESRESMTANITATTTTISVHTTTATVNKTGYIPPEDLKTPSLIDRMATAFIFVIPAYFTVQVFSSSLLEDKMLRRLEVLLSAVGRRKVLAGKILPYFVLSTLFAVAVAVISGSPLAFIFAMPVILFLFAAHSFVVVLSRSYREATFLLLVASLLITIYAFIPAIFSTAIPLSKISPVTLLLSYMGGESIDTADCILSFGHYTVMIGLLLYMSAKGLNPDVIHSNSITGKITAMSKLCVRDELSAFVFAFLSISFAFMAELLALLALFVLPQFLLIPALLVSVAVVEELIKGSIILSKPDERRVIATALGFFAGEKFLIVFNVLQQYSIAFLGKYLLLPLALHILTAAIFVLAFRRWGVMPAFLTSIAVHAAYDYAVVMLLA